MGDTGSGNKQDVNKAWDLLLSYAMKRESKLRKSNRKFAHYTSAEVAAKILINRDIWMRNALSMNDYREVEFGTACLEKALGQYGNRLNDALNKISSGLGNKCLGWIKNTSSNRHQHTYLTSLSEHDPENSMGLLSMWRAYGGPVAGVALIFKSDCLDIGGSQLESVLSPVIYGEGEFIREFKKFVGRLEKNRRLFKKISGTCNIQRMIYRALHYAILSAKHEGFREEREWRVLHSPRQKSSKWVRRTFETVRGKPEVVYHCPLRNDAGMNLPELDIKKLLDQIIIGPCQNSQQIASTFEDILKKLGFRSPGTFIEISNIPLRQRH